MSAVRASRIRLANPSRFDENKTVPCRQPIFGDFAMRFARLLIAFLFLATFGLVQAKPIPPDKDKKEEIDPPFKPIEIKSELAEGDPKDLKLNNPSRKFPVKLHKDKTYIIDM